MAKNNYDIGEAFKEIENELIDSMMRNLKRHKEWEVEEGFDWIAWQVEQLKSLEEYRINNRKKFSDKFKDINSRIEELIIWAREQGGADAEADLLANLGRKRDTARGVGIDFFRLNNRKMDALVNATTNDFERAEYAVLRRSEDEYRQIIYNSQVYANSGAGTYAQAVDMATKDFLTRGIQCIEYANGSRHTISDYADMAIKTATKRAYLAGEGERRAEWGEHLVIVNKRTDACPKCMKFEGRVFIDDVYSGGTPEDGEYPLLSDAMEMGLYHPRCRDSHTTYYEGINTPPSRPTREDFDRAVEIEEQETQLATAKRNAERYDRLAKYSLDPQNKQKYQARADEWTNEQYSLAEIIDTDNIPSGIMTEEDARGVIENARQSLIDYLALSTKVGYPQIFRLYAESTDFRYEPSLEIAYRYYPYDEEKEISDYIGYNPNLGAFNMYDEYDRHYAITHDLSHRFEKVHFGSLTNNSQYIEAIEECTKRIFDNHGLLDLMKKAKHPLMKNLAFLGLLDSLSQGGIQYGFGHEYNYWLKSDETTIDVDRVRSEVFADLSAMMLLHPEDVAETQWLLKELYDFFEEVV